MAPDVVRQIRKRTKKGETPTEGWQRMYSVIFPNDKTIPSPYVEDIGQLYTERVRQAIANEFAQHLHSTLDSLSMAGITNEPSAIKAACISHLSKAVDQFVTGRSSKDEESIVATAQNQSDCSFSSTSYPYRKDIVPPLSSGPIVPDCFEQPTHARSLPYLQKDTTSYLQEGVASYHERSTTSDQQEDTHPPNCPDFGRPRCGDGDDVFENLISYEQPYHASPMYPLGSSLDSHHHHHQFLPSAYPTRIHDALPESWNVRASNDWEARNLFMPSSI
ncbi:hypothetical protein G6011_04321 [Alternaria panax]|uniref:Uncharacterized protein n=1 Tax=Alternaria panax TaxID=48097 RepID=A0AAD4NSH3_9PLEO|nr:hypothetical protein G6011_04321 [Alternaria panax]